MRGHFLLFLCIHLRVPVRLPPVKKARLINDREGKNESKEEYDRERQAHSKRSD
jgi:hypothetical protein